MEKTPLEIAQQAFIDWLQLVDDVLADAMLSFEEFTGHGLRRNLEEAGAALARAEHSTRQALALLLIVIGQAGRNLHEEAAPGDDQL